VPSLLSPSARTATCSCFEDFVASTTFTRSPAPTRCHRIPSKLRSSLARTSTASAHPFTTPNRMTSWHAVRLELPNSTTPGNVIHRHTSAARSDRVFAIDERYRWTPTPSDRAGFVASPLSDGRLACHAERAPSSYATKRSQRAISEWARSPYSSSSACMPNSRSTRFGSERGSRHVEMSTFLPLTEITSSTSQMVMSQSHRYSSKVSAGHRTPEHAMVCLALVSARPECQRSPRARFPRPAGRCHPAEARRTSDDRTSPTRAPDRPTSGCARCGLYSVRTPRARVPACMASMTSWK
jgi:hypothetical protein